MSAGVFNNAASRMQGLAVQYFPDTCTIQTITQTSDGAGGSTPGTSNAYTNIRCGYKPLSGDRFDANGKLITVQAYSVTIPVIYDNAGTLTRVNFDATAHRILVNARGSEPAKTFRVQAPANETGIVYEVLVTQENNE